MEKYTFKNVAGTMQHIEKWLEKVLAASLHDDPTATACAPERCAHPSMKQFHLDRDSLEVDGLDRESQDRVYRSFFLYCNGMHELIGELSRKNQQIGSKLWIAFIRLFQYYDPSFQESFAAFIKKQRDDQAQAVIATQAGLIDSLQKANKELVQELTFAHAECSGAQFEQQLSLAAAQAVHMSLRERAAHTEHMHAMVIDRNSRLEESCRELRECLASTREMVMDLAVAYHDSQTELTKRRAHCEGLEKEHEEMLRKSKLHDGVVQRISEDLNKFKVKCMEAAQEKDQLLDAIAKQMEVKSSLQGTVQHLQAVNEDLLTVQRDLMAALQGTTKVVCFAAQAECRYHALGDRVQRACLQVQGLSGMSVDVHDEHQQSTERLLMQCIEQLDQGVVQCLGDDVKAAVRAAADQVQRLEHHLLSMQETSFLRRESDQLCSLILLMGEKSAQYDDLFKQLTAQQRRAAAADLMVSVYGSIADRLLRSNSELSVRLENVSDDLQCKHDENNALHEQLNDLAAYQQKFFKLQQMHGVLETEHKFLKMQKDVVDGELKDALKRIDAMKEVKEQLSAAVEHIADLEHQLDDKHNHVLYLQTESKRLSTLVNEVHDVSAAYEGVLEPLAEGLKVLANIIALGEESFAQGLTVFDSATTLTKEAAVQIVCRQNIRDEVEDVSEKLRLQQEIYTLDDDGSLTHSERQRMRNIIQVLMDLPSNMLYFLRVSDDTLLAKQEVVKWQKELERVKSFSAKERNRLTRLVLPDKPPVVS